jgi:hypothetical protein
MTRWMLPMLVALAGCGPAGPESVTEQVTEQDWHLETEQLTRGPMHHFFGYIGHVRTIPWSGDNRYVLALRTPFQDRMPAPGEPADVVIVDTAAGNAVVPIEQSRAWNFQQGTMFYWNPEAPDTQFFFNDRDPATGRIFTVLYDIAARSRVREFRFDDTPVANGGVAQNGGRFLALNYGRMARLRPVTGYPGAFDFTGDALHPADDGIHVVEVGTGQRRLLVSFAQLADLVRPVRPDVDRKALFINHSLWSRDDQRVYFYVRGEFDNQDERLDIACTIRADGSGLTMLDHVGGHPEWESGSRMIGARGDQQVIYDVDARQVVGTIGTPEIFPRPGGDIALSPDGEWFVNGHSAGGENVYTVLRRSDGTWARLDPVSRGPYTGGELRIDGAPAWNRTSDAIAFPAIDPADGSRQTFVIHVRRRGR